MPRTACAEGVHGGIELLKPAPQGPQNIEAYAKKMSFNFFPPFPGVFPPQLMTPSDSEVPIENRILLAVGRIGF